MHDSDVQEILDAQILIAINGRTLIADEMAMMEACKTEKVYNELQEHLKDAAQEEIVEDILAGAQSDRIAEETCRRCVVSAFV